MSDFSPILVLQIKICIKPDRHGKGSNKIWETLSFWRNFFNNGAIRLQSLIWIDSTLGMRCRLYGYQYSEIIRSLMSVYFCGGSCIEAEKYDAKPTYKKFLGYRPGVAVIGDLIVGIENRRTKQEQRQNLLWLCLARRRKPKGQQLQQHKCPFPPEGHAEEVLWKIWTEQAYYPPFQNWLRLVFWRDSGRDC